MTQAAIQTWLNGWSVPGFGPLSQVATIHSVQIDDQVCTVSMSLHWLGPKPQIWQAQLLEALKQAFPEIIDFDLHAKTSIKSHKVKAPLQPLPRIKNIIAIGSGKGGVGKSTVSAQMALLLANFGAKVGLLDADIYGPNQPELLGQSHAKLVVEGGRMQPIKHQGLAVMSMHHLMAGKDEPVIWRGPMASKALVQMVQSTDWGDLDYLIVDLPPGTGDIQLTLSQKLPLTAAVMVTTPQTLSCLDTAKGIAMFQSVDIPVLGVIENMSHITCLACGHQQSVWGEGGGAALAQHYHVPFLGSLPFNDKLAASDDIALWLAEQDQSCYAHCAERLSFYSAALPKHTAPLMPPVVVESGRKSK